MSQTKRLVTIPGDIQANLWRQYDNNEGRMKWFWRVSTQKSGESRVAEGFGIEGSADEALAGIQRTVARLTGATNAAAE